MKPWKIARRTCHMSVIRPEIFQCRSLYISGRSTKSSRGPRTFSYSERQDGELEKKIKQMKAYSDALKSHIREQDELVSQKKKAEKVLKESKVTETDVNDDDLNVFMEALDLPDQQTLEASTPVNPLVNGPKKRDLLSSKGSRKDIFDLAPTTTLPAKLLERIDYKLLKTAGHQPNNWIAIVDNLLFNDNGLQGLSQTDITSLVFAIPLEVRSQLMPKVHEMLWDANMKPSKLILDLTMASYAHIPGNMLTVKAFFDQLISDGHTPDNFTYGHLLKALGKANDLRGSVQAVKDMQSRGITPSMPVYTTLIQTCIRVQDYDQAFQVFDMLKFLSTSTAPDVRIYNSLILAAAKQFNVERALSLYDDMTTRPLNPIIPNEETYNTLIYACARDPKTHLKAWQLLLEMQDRGFSAGRKVISSMLYLCGTTGELLFARAIFRQLCMNPESWPDSFAFNSLLNTYANHKQDFISPILTTAVGSRLRSSFLFDVLTPFPDLQLMPPFLPIPALTSATQVILESKALFMFMMDNEKTKHRMINDRTILTYISIPVKLKYSLEEFKERYSHVKNHNHYTFEMALKACIEFKDLDYAQEIWSSRGLWRRTPAFRRLSKDDRDGSDFHFAGLMVDLFAITGELDQAVKLLQSTKSQFRWTKAMLIPLLNKAAEIEDSNIIRAVQSVLSSYYQDD